MHRDNPSDGTNSSGDANVVPGSRSVDHEMVPPDGAVATFGDRVSVFCAACMKWVNCYDDIPPETARDRHTALFHGSGQTADEIG
jgi:hypothetical protein